MTLLATRLVWRWRVVPAHFCGCTTTGPSSRGGLRMTPAGFVRRRGRITAIRPTTTRSGADTRGAPSRAF